MNNFDSLILSAKEWTHSKSANEPLSEYYCETRDIFQARLDKMILELINYDNVSSDIVYLAAAMAGELGNNSFDHNLGAWPDVMGIFFGVANGDGKTAIVLADRGRGLLSTLKKAKPVLQNDREALTTAFNERISGRAPESRGNGLKFVKESVKTGNMHLHFHSGSAFAELNDDFCVQDSDDYLRGCLAILIINNK